jgi:hypothetical protein
VTALALAEAYTPGTVAATVMAHATATPESPELIGQPIIFPLSTAILRGGSTATLR